MIFERIYSTLFSLASTSVLTCSEQKGNKEMFDQYLNFDVKCQNLTAVYIWRDKIQARKFKLLLEFLNELNVKLHNFATIQKHSTLFSHNLFLFDLLLRSIFVSFLIDYIDSELGTCSDNFKIARLLTRKLQTIDHFSKQPQSIQNNQNAPFQTKTTPRSSWASSSP